ncbi:hypothetical protein Taro_013680, partial [Colocasia esculenta]|nr:hypothetical protein [Colocasia esculenta]
LETPLCVRARDGRSRLPPPPWFSATGGVLCSPALSATAGPGASERERREGLTERRETATRVQDGDAGRRRSCEHNREGARGAEKSGRKIPSCWVIGCGNMSGTLRHGLAPKALYHASASEGLSRERRGASGRSVRGVPSSARAGQAQRSKWKPLLSTTFLHKGLVVMKAEPSQAPRRPAVSKVPGAALAMDSSCQLVENFKLDGNATLQDGVNSFLKLEIDDPQVQAVEFLILDEPQNKWLATSSLPPPPCSPTPPLDFELHTIVSLIHQWLSAVGQKRKRRRGWGSLVEFEEARKELQLELEKGISLEELRKNLRHGDYQSNVSKQPDEKRHYTVGRTQCKKRDITQIISKHVPEAKKDNISHTPKTPTVLESYLQSKEEEDGGNVSYKKTFKLDNKELLVLVTNPSGRKKVYVVTDREGPLTLHWALSKKAREWMSPPSSILPRGSVLKDQACEAPFVRSTLPNMSYQIFVWFLDCEISQAQDRLTSLLQNAYKTQPQHREILRMILSTVGRGGEGDAGQRIRDEILVIQRNNDCKGGMMEEWHQKLHNNTSPDDVIICQALMDYIKSDFDINVYWNTLNSNGITKEHLLSYDRAIHSEPSFRHDQKEGLLRDLGHYMRTLKAVHSGADLESSIAICMGYKDEGEGFMVGVQVNPVHGLPSGFPETLKFVLEHVEDRNVEALLEGLLKARMDLRPLLLGSHDRLKDLLFLDLSLDSTVRTAIERGYEDLNNAHPERLMYLITLVLENLALSSDNNEDLIYCIKGWDHALEMCQRDHGEWALYAKSFLDRTRLALASKAEHYQHALQPSAEYLGSLLGVDQWAVSIFTEEIIRSGSAASLSALLNRLDPVLRKVAHLGSWQVISPVEVAGYVVAVDELLAVQDVSYERPTILVARSVKGEEEIPEGTVAVLTPDMPDVLSHVSVRARNSKVKLLFFYSL